METKNKRPKRNERPKRFAPLIQEPIASQLWDFCEKTGSAPHVVVTLALHEWLKGHSNRDRVA